VGARTETLTDASDFVICPMLCYSSYRIGISEMPKFIEMYYNSEGRQKISHNSRTQYIMPEKWLPTWRIGVGIHST